MNVRILELKSLFAVAACLGLFTSVQANPIAVNFRASAMPALAFDDMAGVIPQANWNDINVGAGALSGGPVFDPLVLVDHTGSSSGVTIETSITTGYAANSAFSGSADMQMMKGALYLRQADSGSIMFSNLPVEMQESGYDVYVYFEATTHPRDISVTIGDVTAQGLDQSVFSGEYVEGTSATTDSNYLRFRGMNAATFSMTIGTVASSLRAGVTGIQIVPPDYTPPVPLVPAAIDFFTASALVISNTQESVDLSWSVSNATAISISPDVGSVSATGTVTVTPGGLQTYVLSAVGETGTETRQVTIRLPEDVVPNIVIFIADDLGWQDTSYVFWNEPTEWNKLYRTPGMERLADAGRAFTQAYASGPVCTASRVSIMLGQAPVRHGTTFISGLAGNNTETIRSAVQDNGGMNEEEWTRSLPRILSDMGYRSINVGKAHFGPDDPLLVGFNRNRYGNSSGSPIGNGSDAYHQWVDGVEVHLSEALTMAAKEEVDDATASGEPFFLYLSHYAVHTPILEDSRFSTNYPSVTGTTRAMCTLIEGMDKSLVDLLDHLEAKGIAEQTLVFFMSDHGGLSYRNGDSFYDDGPEPSRKFNWPLRGGKNDAYEGGLRIPFFVSWAKNDPSEPMQQDLPITPGSREERPIIHADMLPTILNILGHPERIPDVVDGKDFSGFITGNAGFARENRFFWHAPNFWLGTTAKPDSAMREDQYKIVYTYDTGDGVWELFDLQSDIGEQTNLMSITPEVGVRMARELKIYLESENANYPTRIADGSELAPIMPLEASVVDLDGDGLPDASEDVNRNGLVDPEETSPDNPDSDEDSTPDGAELEMGLDPLDRHAYFKLEMTPLSDGSYRLSWPSLPGNAFALSWSTTLTNWSTMAETIPASSDAANTRYDITPDEAKRFYRAELK